MENRRDFFKVAGAAAVGAQVLNLASPAQAQTASGKFKIIDFRNRPPLRAYKGLYDLKNNFLMKAAMKVKNRGANTLTAAMNPDLIDKPEGMEAWWKEIDEAGINAVVVNGRYAAGLLDFSMDSDTLASLQNKYTGRFFGLAQLNLDQDLQKTAAELETAITKLGLRGANLEPGYQTVGLGKMGTFTDDSGFWPILEVLTKTGAFLLIQTGLFAGSDISFNNPAALDRMLQSFPKVNVVLAHGGYPYISEVLGLCAKHPQLHVSADVYMFWPNGFLYAMNLERIPEQLVFGTAFPFAAIKPIVEDTPKFPAQYSVSDSTMESYLYGNAARLLKSRRSSCSSRTTVAARFHHTRRSSKLFPASTRANSISTWLK
jgi:predicted TIM-barrel fold metal-dependent hydrolase